MGPRKLCVQQLLFSSSKGEWFFPGRKDQGLWDLGQPRSRPTLTPYLLVRRRGLVSTVCSAGQVADRFGVCGFALGGLVSGLPGKVALFPRGRVRGQQRQQGAAGGSGRIVVLWMCNCNEKV